MEKKKKNQKLPTKSKPQAYWEQVERESKGKGRELQQHPPSHNPPKQNTQKGKSNPDRVKFPQQF